LHLAVADSIIDFEVQRRQRYTVRWTKLDKSIKFFHATTTERYRINIITSIDTSNGLTLIGQDEKAAHICQEYKSRLSCSFNTEMQFNLQTLVQEQDMQSIQAPVSKEDIDNIIKLMPTDKAPGCDGFNGFFLKKCWSIIKEDIYQLCLDFFNGRVDLHAINTSFITLEPKVNSLTTLNDFRHISLINCVVKIIKKKSWVTCYN
jgi:Holliday junction resolvase RusA-like endonuclease